MPCLIGPEKTTKRNQLFSLLFIDPDIEYPSIHWDSALPLRTFERTLQNSSGGEPEEREGRSPLPAPPCSCLRSAAPHFDPRDTGSARSCGAAERTLWRKVGASPSNGLVWCRLVSRLISSGHSGCSGSSGSSGVTHYHTHHPIGTERHIKYQGETMQTDTFRIFIFRTISARRLDWAVMSGPLIRNAC